MHNVFVQLNYYHVDELQQNETSCHQSRPKNTIVKMNDFLPFVQINKKYICTIYYHFNMQTKVPFYVTVLYKVKIYIVWCFVKSINILKCLLLTETIKGTYQYQFSFNLINMQASLILESTFP